MNFQTSAKMKACKIGDRIECQEYFGTVKYIGEVQNYQGSWIGIDWDLEERGKHNGTVNGIKYFKARTETSGSFVRPEKLEFGHTLVQAITSRYGHIDDEATRKHLEQKFLQLQQSMKASLLEFVGFNKITDQQSNYDKLLVVDVRSQNVNSIGKQLELRQLFPNILELDLSKNLLTSWNSVFEVCEALQNITWLNVSENCLSMPDDYADYNFKTLKVLICGTMNLEWNDVLKLGRIFSNLEELLAPNNKISNLDVGNDDFQYLKLIDIENNNIEKWSEVCKLGQLPELLMMNLDNCRITDISFEDELESGLFAKLDGLCLRNNLLDEWASIGELNKLKALTDFRFAKNPLYEKENPETSMQLITARIANLKLINRSDIEPDQRRGAELDYLKKYGLEWLAVKGDESKRASFLKEHNRYMELIEKFGELEEDELKVQPKTIQGTLVQIEIIYDQKIIMKKLPQTILVQKLIMLVQRLFNLSERPLLMYVSKEHPDIEIELNDECKELGLYAVQDGDKLIAK